jgi:pilus assembly protein Flp/PilA
MVDRLTQAGERFRSVLDGLNAREEGQGMVEYALILVLISIVVIVILTTLGHTVNNVFSNISHGLSS